MALKPLVLSVDATVDPFKRALSEGRTALSDFGKAASELAQDAQAEVQKILADPSMVSALERNISGQINAMRRQAEAALRAPGNLDASGGFTAKGSMQAAEAIEKLALAERTRAAAAAAATAADAKEALGLQTIAVAARENATALGQRAATLRDQAGILAAVEAEQVKMGVVAQGTSDTVVRGHQRMSIAGMELTHVMRGASDSFAAGLPPMMILTEHLGMLAEAAAFVGPGEGMLGKVGAFMSGGWGIAIMAGVSVLGALISHVDLFKNELGEAEKKLEEEAHTTDIARQAQQAYDNTLEGSIEKQRKLTEELDKRIKSQRQLNQEQLSSAKSDLQHDRDRLPGAETELTAARDALKTLRQQVPSAPDPEARSAAAIAHAAEIQRAEDRLAKAQLERDDLKNAIPTAERHVRAAEVVIAQGDLAGRADPKVAQREALQKKIDDAFADYAAGKITIAIRDSITLGAQKAIDALGQKPARTSASGENALGQMSALLEHLFPQARITARQADHSRLTADGNVSDHAVGRAIDFVVPGRMNPSDYESVLQDLVGAGVKIRRNAHGTLQFFGPGHGPHGAGDHSHDNHYHVAFEGAPSPEEADKRAAEAAARAQSEQQTLDQSMAEAKAQRTKVEREGVTDAERLAELDKQELRDRLAEKLNSNKKLKLDHTALDAYEAATEQMEEAKVDQRLHKQLTDKELTNQAAALTLQSQLLEIQGQLAPTLKERLAIALALLDNDRQQQLLANNRDLNDGKVTQAEHDVRAAGISQRADAQGNVVRRQNATPLGAYRDQLKRDTQDMDTALEGVAAHGLQSLEDGLLGLINGTESVAGAFKKMAASIIADLARIAIEKAILSVIGLKDGGVVQHFAGGGVVFGPGGEREDRVPAMLSPGEFVVNARSTRRHRALLAAINDNAISHFADGGLVGAVAYPALPSGASLRGGGGGGSPIIFDMRGAVVTEDLLHQVNAISARYATATLTAAPSLTRQEMSEAAMQQIPT